MNLGKRVMILGSSASGKSTLAVILGKITGMPVIHLDRLFWKPNWVKSTKEEMNVKVLETAKKNEWIIDGNYFQTFEFRLERADTIIYIDLKRYICIYRALKRWLQNFGKTRKDMGDGCPEKIDIEFLLWIWNYPKRYRKKTFERISKFCEKNNNEKSTYYLRTRKDVKNFIKEVSDYYLKQDNTI